MSSKGLGHEHGSAAAPRIRMVTPPPPSASSNDHESSMRNPAARRHHHTTAHQSSPYPSRIQIKLDAPLSLLGSLNVADNESSITTTTTISLGRSLHTSGIFRAPAANTVSANDNNNVAGGGTSAAAVAAAAAAAAAAAGGGSSSTTPTSAIDDDELYAFLKLPGLSHDTMENDTDDEDDNTLVRGPTPPKHL